MLTNHHDMIIGALFVIAAGIHKNIMPLYILYMMIAIMWMIVAIIHSF